MAALDRLVERDTLVFRRTERDERHFVVLDRDRRTMLGIMETTAVLPFWRAPYNPLGVRPLDLVRGMTYRLANARGVPMASVIGPSAARRGALITGLDGVEAGTILGSRRLRVVIDGHGAGSIAGRRLYDFFGEEIASVKRSRRILEGIVDEVITIRQPEAKGMTRLVIALPLLL
jgi:hypothetical protein